MKQLKVILKGVLPFVLAILILWWMYRGMDYRIFLQAVTEDMDWRWMLLSLAVGVLPGVFRALRWRMALKPMGEDAPSRVCCDAIFLSYASSLIIPRVGEVTRCGTLRQHAGVSFTKSLGTVVTERIVDSVLIVLLTIVAFVVQLPWLIRFLHETGTDWRGLLSRFTSTGYLVTAACIVIAIVFIVMLLWRVTVFRKGKHVVQGFWEGIMSLRHVSNLPLYLLYSLGIWAGYFLHFYLAFFCFEATASVSLPAAFLIFCIGSFAVLVPTPNGAGPWHFAVKTMLVLYGVAEQPAIVFALVTHTIQTALVVLLGAYGWVDLLLRKK